MLNQSSLIDQLARQRVTEFHARARRERLAGRGERLPRARVYVGRMLVALGTRIAPTEARALTHSR
jgi:hypothetical protein